MAEKILNTRLLLKYDTYANWTSNNPVLKTGEMAVATIANNAANVESTGFTNLPNIVLKVGDGTSHYNDLKFVSALAADVHGWAKEANKPGYAYNEIDGLEDYIKQVANANIKNTDTQYNLVATDADNYKYELRSKGLEDVEWTKVADLDLSGLVGRVAALEGLVGNTKVSDQIANAINALDFTKVEATQGHIISYVEQTDGIVKAETRELVAADIPELAQSKITGLETALAGKETAGEAAKAEAAAKGYTDTELAAKIGALDYNDPDYVEGQFVTKVTETDGVIKVEHAAVGIANVTGLKTRLAGIEGDVTNLTNNKQDTVDWDDTAEYSADNKAATVASVVNRINALDYTGGDFGTSKFVTKVTETDGIVAAEYAQPAVADISGLSGEISRLDGRIDGKQDQLYFTSTPDNADNKVATQSYINEAVADLNGAMHFVGKVNELPSDNSQYSAGDVILVPDAEDDNVMVEYVFDGTTWQKLGHESIYQLKSEAATQHEALQNAIDNGLQGLENSKQDNLTFDGTYNAETNKVATVATVTTAVNTKVEALDNNDAVVAGQFVTAAVQTDGLVVVSRRALSAGDFAEDVVPEAAVNGLTERLAGIDKAVTDGDAATLEDAKEYTDAQIKTKVEALDYTDTAVEKQFVTAVSETDGIIAVTRRGLEAADIPVIEQTQVNGLGDALAAAAKAGTDAAATAEANAKNHAETYTTNAINALDYSIAEEDNKVVSAFTVTDGVLVTESVKKIELAAIAKTGNVNDLVQTTGDVLILDCGTSAGL